MYDTIQLISAYMNSVHRDGSFDSLGREKPFFNIVTSAVNIWYRATDIDRKDITILPKSSAGDTVLSLAANILLRDWMDREKFGVFLNDWGRTMATYGSAVCKFSKNNGRLIPSVCNWNNLIVDPVDFSSGPVIEKIFYTQEQLKLNTFYNQEVVDSLLKAKSTRTNLEGQDIDNKSEFVTVYEIHGRFSQAAYKHSKGLDSTIKDEDYNIFFQQMHACTYLKGDNEDSYDDFVLYSGKEDNPYIITHLIPEKDRTLSIGAVEYLFDSQWMANHSVKLMKDYLDVASKQIFQTADPRFVGRNVLVNFENGAIFHHSVNSPLTQVNNSALNTTAIQNFGAQFINLSREITSTPDALRGNTLPSGTPYSLGASLQQQASSLFEIMVENKGLAIEDMMREFILPYLKTKMDTSEEIVAILDEKMITQLDAMYVPREAIKRENDRIFEEIGRAIQDNTAPLPSPYQPELAQQQVKSELAVNGNMRSIKPSDISTKTWKKLLENFEWRVTVQVTNEPIDKQATLQTLSTILQIISTNQAVLENPNAKLIFRKILELTSAISPVELSSTSISQQPQQAVQTIPKLAPINAQ